MKNYLSILVILCLPVFAFGGTLKGKVTDKQGVSLPFATVYIKGTTLGTSANAEGEYQLELAAGSYLVLCQYIGFTQSSYNVNISGGETVIHNFSLADQSVQMKEFTVRASEDPAIYIMKKVIKRRSFHLKQVKSFQTDIYLKGVFRTRKTPGKVLGQEVDATELGLDSAGKGIIYLCEELASYYSQGTKERTVIHSVRESGSPNGFGFSQFPSVITFYENNIQISEQVNPRGFISPVSDNALFYYNFKLDGDFMESGYTIYKIKVTPKRLFEPLFTGTIYIVDEDWAIHSLNMSVNKKSNMDLLDTLRIEQVFLPLKKDEWVIKQQVLYPTITIFGFDIAGNFVTVYNKQKINEPIPDTIFNNKIVSVYDKTANKKDTSYWTETREIPLEEDESRDYVKKDSIRKIYEDPVYLDSLRRRGNRLDIMDLVYSGISHSTKKNKLRYETNALLTGLVNYNIIEGINIAPKIKWIYRIDTGQYLRGKIALRYGVGNEHFNAIGRISYLKQQRDWIGRSEEIGIEGGKYVYQFNPNNPIEGLYNTVSTLFYRRNYLKLYERWNAALFFNKNYGNGFRWSAKFSFQQRIPMVNTTDFTFAKSDVGGFTDNLPPELSTVFWKKHNAAIADLAISWQPGYTYTLYPDFKVAHRSNWPVFTLSYQKGVPYLFDSEVDFDKWRFSIRHDISLKLLGNLDYNLIAGGFLNDASVSIPDLTHLSGNQLLLARPYVESFQLAPYYAYSTHESLYAMAHIEWGLKGFLTNKIPLLRQLRWYLVTGTNIFYANENLYHVEAFAGIDNFGWEKFRILRIDYVHAWSSLHQQTSAIRLGISTSGLFGGLRLEDNNAEW